MNAIDTIVKETREQRVISMITSHFGVEEGEVTSETNFVNDLGADAEEMSRVVVDLGNEFGMNIPREVAGGFSTVQDVIKHVAEHLGEEGE